jgi:AbiV family abortive infection protein
VASVTRELVLEGIIRHTVDARFRLEDGLSLFEQSRYGGAVILGTIALENIGRANWLASLADDESLRAKKCTMESLARELKGLDHQQKLRLGLAGFSMDHAPSISEQALRREYPEDWEKVLERNLAAIKTIRKKAPAALHVARTTAQYPELNEADYSWKSSADVSAATARNTLRQTGENFYLLQGFCLKKIAGLRELSTKLGVEDAAFEYLDPYTRLRII